MVRRYWTKEEIEVLKQLYPTTPTPDLACLLNRSVGSISLKAYRLGVKADIFSPARNKSWRQRLSESHKGQTPSLEQRRKASERSGEKHPRWGKHWSHDQKIILSLAHKGQHSSPKTEFQNLPRDKYWELQQRAIFAHHKHPNKWEKIAIELLNKACPGEYKFVGDGSLIINGFNPDFTNINGKKKVIEVFGEYWHKGRGIRRWHQTELGRIMVYNSMGYDCLILWDMDLEKKTEAELLAIIRAFNKKRHRN